ncbi:MAG: PadR family transcriptional regulator [Microbacteriaceae bacterium]
MTPPVFAHGHLRLYLLSLLAERSMHGYELIQALSDRFGGTYVPSAGTIYPRLAKLQDEGLVAKTIDGRKSVYAITDAGRAELAEREPELDGIEDELSDSVRRLADEVRTSVNDAMRTLRADLAAAARDARHDIRSDRRASSTGTRPATSEPVQPDPAASTAATAGTGAADSAAPHPEQTTSHDAPRTAGPRDRGSSQVALQEAEMVITELRQRMRADLRRQVATSGLDASTVAELRDKLAAVRRDVTAGFDQH